MVPYLRSMPPECLERIVYHASQDHRTLSTLMQVNSTLFRMATPYLYTEPFKFVVGDEFLFDWDTATWTRHLREIRHAKLLILYLSCSDIVQSMLQSGKGQGQSTSPNSDSSVYWDKHSIKTSWSQEHSNLHHTLLEPDTDLRLTPSPPPLGRIPVLLEKLLKSHSLVGEPSSSSSSLLLPLSKRQKSSSSYFSGKKVGVESSGLSVNYLNYVEHLDLDTFLSTSIQVLFSPSFSVRNEYYTSKSLSQHSPSSSSSSSAKGNQYSTERLFVERALLRSMAQHITTLSISVTTFVRLQRDLMEYVLEPSSSSCSTSSPSSSSSSSSSPQVSKNSAGIRTGKPLSQLSRLNINGLHAELKPKVLRAIRWFIRRHVAVYPGMLKSIAFEGPGDTIVNRRRQRNRNVVAVEPIQPGVVHFNNQNNTDDDATDEIEEEDEHVITPPPHLTLVQLQQFQQQQQQQQNQNQTQNQYQNQHQNQHLHHIQHPTQHQNHNQLNNQIGINQSFMGGTAHGNNIPPNNNTSAPEVFPAVFHSQYYLLSRNPDESCELDFLGIIQELYGQLEVVDLSQWSWSVITQQALEMIPVSKLKTLRFHPRTRIQWRHGPSFLRSCPELKVLEIHAFNPAMLDQVELSSSLVHDSVSSGVDCPTTSNYPSSLNSLSLTGSVPNVLPAVRDAILVMGRSLKSINLSAHLDGFLTDKQTHELMDWSTSLSTLTIPQLTTLQLHGHLALSFDAPLLLELCPSLRHFGLAIKSYTSSSFVNSDQARVLPRFMIPWESDDSDNGVQGKEPVTQKFQLKVLELQGPWILTDNDINQISEQICGLVNLNLVGCRFFPKQRQVESPDSGDNKSIFGGNDDEDEERSDDTSPVARLVEKIQNTLRVLRIHRRGLESKPRRDSSDFSYYSSIHSNATAPNLLRINSSTTEPSEPVLAFKKRFPNVKLQIQEKQHEHSFVLAPSADILRRIHRPTSQARRSSLSIIDLMEHPGPVFVQHDFDENDSVWRRAKNAVPFFKSFGRNKSHRSRMSSGYDSHRAPSW
ncbi:hypothetical protein BGZ46_002717, partial [Entomortierella lignicola]